MCDIGHNVVCIKTNDAGIMEEELVPYLWIQHCPHFICRREHYLQGGTCRCTDPTDKAMGDKGYTFKEGRWQ